MSEMQKTRLENSENQVLLTQQINELKNENKLLLTESLSVKNEIIRINEQLEASIRANDELKDINRVMKAQKNKFAMQLNKMIYEKDVKDKRHKNEISILKEELNGIFYLFIT